MRFRRATNMRKSKVINIAILIVDAILDRRISSKYGSSRKLRTHFVRISSNSILFFSLLRNLSFSIVFDHVPLTNFNEALTHPPRGVRCFTLLSPRRRRHPVKQREVCDSRHAFRIPPTVLTIRFMHLMVNPCLSHRSGY